MNNLAALPVLALELFAPWFLILGWLYCAFPRQPRTAARRRYDIAVLVLALLSCIASLHLSFAAADRSHGHLWPQVLATSVGYGVFLGVRTGAFLLRRRWLVAR